MKVGEAVVTDPAAALAEVPPPPAAPSADADDHGAFRAVDPVSGTAVVIRPTTGGLVLHGSSEPRTIPWEAVDEVQLFCIKAHTMQVAAARVVLADGTRLAIARMHTAGAGYLPVELADGGARLPLIRVERMRLLTAAIVERAGLAEQEGGVFRRGARLTVEREITPRPRVLPEWAPPLLLLLSVVGLVLVFDLTLEAAAVVTLVLLVHEYGHVIAMRTLGLKVRGVLFLPLLGAATVPEQAFPSRWDEARVALAGPMTALPMALTTVLLWHMGVISDQLGRDAFVWSLALNALNLIPLMPLDGGRALLTLTASLRPLTRQIIQFTPVVLSAIALLAFVREPIELGLGAGAFVVFTGAVTRLAVRRQSVHAWMDDSGIDPAALRRALRDVTCAVSGAAREDVDGGVPPAPMTGAQAAGVIAVYCVEVVSIFGIVIVAARWPGLFGL